MGERRLQPFA